MILGRSTEAPSGPPEANAANRFANARSFAKVGLANRCNPFGFDDFLLLESAFHPSGDVSLGCGRFFLSVLGLRARGTTSLSAAALASLCLLRFPCHCRP